MNICDVCVMYSLKNLHVLWLTITQIWAVINFKSFKFKPRLQIGKTAKENEQCEWLHSGQHDKKICFIFEHEV